MNSRNLFERKKVEQELQAVHILSWLTLTDCLHIYTAPAYFTSGFLIALRGGQTQVLQVDKRHGMTSFDVDAYTHKHKCGWMDGFALYSS